MALRGDPKRAGDEHEENPARHDWDHEHLEQLVLAARDTERQCKKEEAQEALCRLVQPDMLRYAAKRLQDDPGAAQDAVQEALGRMIQNLHALRDVRCFDGWLSQILAHAVVDEQKRLGKGRITTTSLEGSVLTDDGTDTALPAPLSNGRRPDYLVVDRDEVLWIWGRLAVQERILVRHLYNGLTAGEISDKMNKTLDQVYHSVQQLRDKAERLAADYRPPRKRRAGRRCQDKELPK